MVKQRSPLWGFLRGVAALTLVALTATAFAQHDYDVPKIGKFKFRGGADVDKIIWKYRQWDVFAKDNQKSDGPFDTTWVEKEVASPSGDSTSTKASVPGAWSEVFSSYGVSGPDAQGFFTASARAYGDSKLLAGGVTATGYSASDIVHRGFKKLKDGSFQQLGGDARGTVGVAQGGTKNGRKVTLRDPIFIRLYDQATSDLLLEDSLFDMSMSLSGLDDGLLAVQGGVLTVKALEGEGSLDISLGSPFTDVRGTLNLAFSGGVVTAASATGVYSGKLPGVGSVADFQSTIGLFDVNFDYRNAGLPDGTFAEVDTLVQGSSEVVPEPSSLALLGWGLVPLLLRRRRG